MNPVLALLITSSSVIFLLPHQREVMPLGRDDCEGPSHMLMACFRGPRGPAFALMRSRAGPVQSHWPSGASGQKNRGWKHTGGKISPRSPSRGRKNVTETASLLALKGTWLPLGDLRTQRKGVLGLHLLRAEERRQCYSLASINSGCISSDSWNSTFIFFKCPWERKRLAFHQWGKHR